MGRYGEREGSMGEEGMGYVRREGEDMGKMGEGRKIGRMGEGRRNGGRGK